MVQVLCLHYSLSTWFVHCPLSTVHCPLSTQVCLPSMVQALQPSLSVHLVCPLSTQIRPMSDHSKACPLSTDRAENYPLTSQFSVHSDYFACPRIGLSSVHPKVHTIVSTHTIILLSTDRVVNCLMISQFTVHSDLFLMNVHADKAIHCPLSALCSVHSQVR